MISTANHNQKTLSNQENENYVKVQIFAWTHAQDSLASGRVWIFVNSLERLIKCAVRANVHLHEGRSPPGRNILPWPPLRTTGSEGNRYRADLRGQTIPCLQAEQGLTLSHTLSLPKWG